MINKDGAHCDGCCNSHAMYGRPFVAMTKEIRELGWKNIRLSGGWYNYCPVCVEDGKHEGGLWSHQPHAKTANYWWE